MSLIQGMANNDVPGRKGSTSRRAFLSASAVTAVAAPLIADTSVAGASPVLTTRAAPDKGLRDLLRQVDPGRIQVTIEKLVSFGTRHTASSQTDPARGIGAATAWVTGQMQAIAATSSGRMTVQQQTFVQSVTTSSGRARPGTAPSPTRTPSGCSSRASPPT